jgi:hypothetical protein
MIYRDSRSEITFTAILPAAATSLILTGCRDKPPAESLQASPGSFEGRRYANAFFGLTVTVPPGWYLPNAQTFDRLMAAGAKLTGETSKDDAGITDADGPEDVAMFSVFQHPLDTAEPSNPGIIAVAEYIRSDSTINSSRDYLKQLGSCLKTSPLDWTCDETITSEKLDGVAFSVMGGHLADEATFVHQTYYVTIRKDYAVCFILSYTNPQEETKLKKILDTIKLEN